MRESVHLYVYMWAGGWTIKQTRVRAKLKHNSNIINPSSNFGGRPTLAGRWSHVDHLFEYVDLFLISLDPISNDLHSICFS